MASIDDLKARLAASRLKVPIQHSTCFKYLTKEALARGENTGYGLLEAHGMPYAADGSLVLRMSGATITVCPDGYTDLQILRNLHVLEPKAIPDVNGMTPCVFIKDYSETEGVTKDLVEAGFVRVVSVGTAGFGSVNLVELLHPKLRNAWFNTPYAQKMAFVMDLPEFVMEDE
jgi:hypothetical protein